MKKTVLALLILFMVPLLLTGCGSKEEKSEEFINYYTFSFDQMFYLMEWYCLHEQIHLKSFQFLQEIRYL